MCAEPAFIETHPSLSPLATMTVAGPNAAGFLQGYVTCDLGDLHPGTAMPMALTDLHGRVIANGWALGDRNEVALVIHPSLVDAIRLHLKKYMVFSRCKFGEMRELNVSLSDRDVGTTLVPLPCSPVSELAESSSQLFKQLCVQFGVVLVQLETTSQFLPQMIGLDNWGSVSFAKAVTWAKKLLRGPNIADESNGLSGGSKYWRDEYVLAKHCKTKIAEKL